MERNPEEPHMPRRTLAAAAVAAFGLAVALPGFGSPQQDSGIRWLTDKKKAFEEARRTGKPIWALFR